VEPQAGARRTVTILFADMVGSTALGERLDPERLQGVLTRYYDAMRGVIERHGGTVEKFIGDAVMAVFGIPNIREDDALRAVRAAAELSDALGDLNVELEGAIETRVHIRVGINTGEVVVTGAAEGTLAAGDAVNVAARLEQAAGVGEILIGAETYQLVRDAVVADQLDPVAVKGKTEPLSAFRVQKVDPAAAGFARRLDAPIVGRQRELSLLTGAFDRAVSDQSSHLFTVLGVGGVGKSRLVDAFVVALGDRATVMSGRCPPYGDGITFLPVVEGVRQVVGLTGAEDADDARGHLAALLGGDDRAERVARQVGHVLGIAGGEATPEETLWAIRLLLEAIARERPLVFVIDDLQWAEPTMLQLVEHVADWSTDSPILLACMARPELLEDRPDWGGGKHNATSITLEPLSDEECGTLVANLLASDDVAPEVRERVAAAAEGHPLFAEELIGILIDEGRLTLDGDEWRPTGDLRDLKVPPTTSALLAARIDRLDPTDRSLLMAASVMGQIFYRQALDDLAGDVDVSAHLSSLMRKQFVRPERSDLSGIDALAFRHLLIRDAAYDGLIKSARADLHERFGEWLEANAPELPEVIGYHFERAYGYLGELGGDAGRVAQLARRAGEYLRLAGSAAFARGDMPAAINLFSRVTSLLPQDSSLVHLYIDLGQAYAETARLDESALVMQRAIELAAAGGDELVTARAKMAQGMFAFWGDPTTEFALQIEQDALMWAPRFDEVGDVAGAAIAWAVVGSFAWSRCRATDASTAWRRAIDGFRATDDKLLWSEYLGWLASSVVWGPIPCRDGVLALEALAEEAREAPVAVSDISESLGTLRLLLGQVEEARTLFTEADRRKREMGRTLPLAHSSQQLGLLERLAGNAAGSERILREGVTVLTEASSSAVSIVAAFHAESLYDLGRYDEADRAAATAIAGWEMDIASTVIGTRVQAMVAARAGRFDDAERTARNAIALIDESDFLVDRADARIGLAEVLELAGRLDDAIEAAAQALSLYEAKGNVLQAGHARARLERLRS
jgi:class 3 adenylate cyclase/tetratricopeptide (TPR) repeat protein